jgi:hypothetical protein
MIMKKVIRLSIGLLTALPFLYVGCEKFDDFLNNDPLVVNGCRIESVYAPWDEANEPSITKGTFSYNTLGQPVSVLFERSCGTGSPSSHYLFRYDAQHRLSDYIEACDNFFDSWHVFKYNDKGLIVQDSTYFWGFMNGNTHPWESDYEELRHSTLFSYDAEGRMTRAISSYFILDENDVLQPFSDTSNYVYNSNGNLNRPGASYDNKINICRTNKIWMFLNRDYSRNNYIPALSYSEKGLPLAFPVTFEHFHFSSADTGTIRFEYNCDNNTK